MKSQSMGDYESCVHETGVGGVPMSYFVVGLIEVVCSLMLVAAVLNRTVCKMWTPASGLLSYMLPIYLSAVYTLIAGMLFVGAMSLFGVLTDNEYVFMGKWFVIRSLSESLAIFLMHPGIGMTSARRSLMVGTLMTLISFALVLLLYLTVGFRFLIVGAALVTAILCLFYTILLVIPISILPRRPALHSYAGLTLVTLLIQCGCLLIYAGHESSAAACTLEIVLETLEFMQIGFILVAFVMDSRFWQGLYVDGRGGQLNEPLLGIWDMDRNLVSVVTSSVMQLERKVVHIIPFSQLRLDTSEYFSGGTARVYKGTYQAQTVAIKFLFCIELTPERIVAFCEEATLLNSLQHENVVTCHGVSIMPPALSLVTEFCANGNLFEFLHSQRSGGSVQRILCAPMPDGVDGQGGLGYAQGLSLSGRGSSNQARAHNHAGRPWLHTWAARWFGGEQGGSLRESEEEEDGTRSTTSDVYRLMEEEEGQLVRASPLLVARKHLLSNDNLSDSARKSNSAARRSSLSSGEGEKERRGLPDEATGTGDTLSMPSRETGRRIRSEPHRGGVSSKARSVSGRLKSPSSVMLTREMGFGLGPSLGTRVAAESERSHRSLSSSRRFGEESTSAAQSDSQTYRGKSLLLITSGKHGQGSTHNPLAESALLSLSLAAAGPSPPPPPPPSMSMAPAPPRVSNPSGLSTGMVWTWLPTRLRLCMMRDCCAGLGFLHAKGFMHCDIKSLNFLVTGDLRIKLADLGEARAVRGTAWAAGDEVPGEGGGVGVGTAVRTLPSNINWSSPETLLLSLRGHTSGGVDRLGDITEAADVWSLAMVLSEIATGAVPFDEQRFQALSLVEFVDLLEEGTRPSLQLDRVGGEGAAQVLPGSPSAKYITWLRDMLDQAWAFEAKSRVTCARLLEIIDEQLRCTP